MRKALIFAAVAEAATGDSVAGRSLARWTAIVRSGIYGRHLPAARVTGIALIALAVACWPGPALVGMLAYSVAVTLYLAYIGLAGGFTGVFLWPAVALHAVLSIFLGRAWLTKDPMKR